MTENELRINGKSFDETISLLEEFMESDDVHGELFTVLRSARDFMENLNEEIQQYRAIGTVDELQVLNRIAEETAEYVKEDKKILEAYKRIGTIEEFKALKEKNEPKEMDRFYCPICRHYFEATDAYNYCPVCGQKMKPIWQ